MKLCGAAAAALGIACSLKIFRSGNTGTDDGANAFEQEHHSNRYTDCRRADPRIHHADKAGNHQQNTNSQNPAPAANAEGVQIESWAPFAEGRNNLFGNGTLVSLAAKYRKSVAQVVLRWLIQRGVVVIPKSVRPERMAENIDVFDFHLAPEDMDLIATLDTRRSCFLSHRDPETVKWLGTMKYEMD